MHPRHPYLNKKPDFVELSKKHPFLAPFVTVVNGKGHIDFKNKDALRALSRSLLLEDFGLDVIIPLESLVPVIPQRLNYILWLEDIFNQSSEQLRGLDIGTGGTAIYALLCARKNNWKMVGTDIVEDSIEFAKKNIQRNGLDELVDAKLISPNPTGGSFFAELEGDFHFSMCNPPFFSTLEESDSMGKSRNESRPSPFAVKTGTSSELVAAGGEMDFLSRMISESRQFPSKVGIFTTMVGIKADLKFLVQFLKSNNALAYSSTTFVQGKTMRWGLAWTFAPEYAPLLLHPTSSHVSTSAPVKERMNCRCPLAAFVLNVKRILVDLEFRFLVNNNRLVEVIGETNTWSNQRRKRREAARKQDSLEPPDTKRVKMSETLSNGDFPSANLEDYDGKSFALHCGIAFSEGESENTKRLEVKHLGGTLGIQGVNQVLQYLRNIYTKHTCVSAN